MVPSTTGKTSLSTSKSPVSSRSTLRTIPPDIATKFTTRPPSSTKQLIPTTKSGPQCPPQIPRSRFHIEFGQHCYEFILRVHKTWPDAERDCKSKGGHLVTISSKAEQDFVYNTVRVSHTTHWNWHEITQKKTHQKHKSRKRHTKRNRPLRKLSYLRE